MWLIFDLDTEEAQVPRSAALRLILNFAPSWFSVSMGTGILSILMYTSPRQFRHMETIGAVLYVLNIVLFFSFVFISVLRYSFFPWALKRTLLHKSSSLFVGTIPMALATIVNATVLAAVPKYGDWAVTLAWTLWWIDVVLTVLCVFGMPLLLFSNRFDGSLETMTAAWLMPFIPAVVCAGSGGRVASVVSPEHAFVTILISWTLLAIGLCMSFAEINIYIQRLSAHSIPEAEQVISAFIPLGPCGQGAFAIIQLAVVGQTVLNDQHFGGVPGVGDIILVTSLVAGLLLWAFGLFWLVHGTACLAIRLCTGQVHFNLSFWALLFPLGVFISGTQSFAVVCPSAFFAWLSVGLLAVLSLLWVVVSAYTIKHTLDGRLLKAPCVKDLPLKQAEPGCELRDDTSVCSPPV